MAGKTLEKVQALKVYRQRLSVLEMAEAPGNISEACRRGGMDRTSFYEWERRSQTHGLETCLNPEILAQSNNTGK